MAVSKYNSTLAAALAWGLPEAVATLDNTDSVPSDNEADLMHDAAAAEVRGRLRLAGVDTDNETITADSEAERHLQRAEGLLLSHMVMRAMIEHGLGGFTDDKAEQLRAEYDGLMMLIEKEPITFLGSGITAGAPSATSTVGGTSTDSGTTRTETLDTVAAWDFKADLGSSQL